MKIATVMNVENLSLLIKKMTSASVKHMEYVPIGCVTEHFECSTADVIDFIEANKNRFEIRYSGRLTVSTPELTSLLKKRALKLERKQRSRKDASTMSKQEFEFLATEFLKFLALDHNHKFLTHKDALDFWIKNHFMSTLRMQAKSK